MSEPQGKGPFPTVLMFPGCSGPRRDHSEYARDFQRLGYASVIVDSNAHRALDATSGCALTTMPWPPELAGDVLVSLDDARRFPFVDRERIVLSGWSSVFYPGCRLGVRDLAPGGWPAKVPALFLLAGAESAVIGGFEACVELAEKLSAAGQAVTTQVYEGVRHAWDISDIAPGHTHIQVPEASADSRQRLLEFLAPHSR